MSFDKVFRKVFLIGVVCCLVSVDWLGLASVSAGTAGLIYGSEKSDFATEYESKLQEGPCGGTHRLYRDCTGPGLDCEYQHKCDNDEPS